jgi:hypothetical protein
MTIPDLPPDGPIPDDPEREIPPEDPDFPPDSPPDSPPEFPETDEPGWRAPGTADPPMRMPSDNPDVETEL